LYAVIAFRAETTAANLIAPYYSKADEEVRMLVKEIIKRLHLYDSEWRNKGIG